jgi:hypothetical protein
MAAHDAYARFRSDCRIGSAAYWSMTTVARWYAFDGAAIFVEGRVDLDGR